MGRRRRAWLWTSDGIRIDNGHRLPGRYVRWNEYTADGRRVCRSRCFRTGRDRDDLRWARRFVEQRNVRAYLGELGDLVRISLRDAAAEFVSQSKASAASRVAYGSSLGMLVGITGEIDACDITVSHINRLLGDRKRRGNSPSTVARHARQIGVFFNWALGDERRYTTSNPVRDSKNPTKASARERPQVSDEQLAHIVESLDGDRRLAVVLAMTTGLDREVIANLTPERVDVDRMMIVVRRPKTQQTVSVLIHPVIRPQIAARLRQSHAGQRLFGGLARQKKDRDWWKRATAAAGCPDLLFRDLRAVAVSRLQRAGLALTDAQRWLGHKSLETTARHYHAPSPTATRAFEELPVPGFHTAEAHCTE